METIKIIITDENGNETIMNGFGSTSSITHDVSPMGTVRTVIKKYVLENSPLHKVEITKIDNGD